jgi:hypothetical protein
MGSDDDASDDQQEAGLSGEDGGDDEEEASGGECESFIDFYRKNRSKKWMQQNVAEVLRQAVDAVVQHHVEQCHFQTLHMVW